MVTSTTIKWRVAFRSIKARRSIKAIVGGKKELEILNPSESTMLTTK